MNRILIIEDEKSVADVIKAYLEKEGYIVYHANTGEKGLKIFKEIDFQLVLLDLMLPDISGEEICRIVRVKSDVYIFMLTAKGTLNDKVEGLSIGADEYLVKPLSPRELVARVNALFRRVTPTVSSKLTFNDGELTIDKENRTVFLNNKDVYLTANEFDILYTLASNSGRVFTREQLIEKALGYDFEGMDRAVDVHIKNIRKKLDDSKNPKYIITVVKVGYKFKGDEQE